MEGRPAPRADRRRLPCAPRRRGVKPAASHVGGRRERAARGAGLGRPSAMHRVFAYGTLLNLSHQRRLFGRRIPWAPAVLSGWRRKRCVGQYFGIVRERGSRTEGGVLLLTRPQLAAADLWEKTPDFYRRTRVRVTSAGRSLLCWVYVPAPWIAREAATASSPRRPSRPRSSQAARRCASPRRRSGLGPCPRARPAKSPSR